MKFIILFLSFAIFTVVAAFTTQLNAFNTRLIGIGERLSNVGNDNKRLSHRSRQATIIMDGKANDDIILASRVESIVKRWAKKNSFTLPDDVVFDDATDRTFDEFLSACGKLEEYLNARQVISLYEFFQKEVSNDVDGGSLLKVTKAEFWKALKQLNDTAFKTTGYNHLSKSTRILASTSSKRAIDGYKASTTIDGVPVDLRQSAKIIFDNHVDRTGIPGRTPLLCNFGVKGSGKTVLLALNMFWFLNNSDRVDGVAIEVTFNDDATDLGIRKCGVKNNDEFEELVIRGILLRLVEFIAGFSFSYPFESINSEAEIKIQKQMLDIKRMSFTGVASRIDGALKIVRQALVNGKECPIILTVDEISKLTESRALRSVFLSLLCGVDDRATEQARPTKQPSQFCLAVSTYGCLDLQKFLTDSNRALDLQPMPPIFPMSFAPKDCMCLPMILAIFSEKYRYQLPYEEKHLMFYRDVSILVMNSGGHPRRVERLMSHLWQFGIDPQIKHSTTTNDADCKTLVERLRNESEFDVLKQEFATCSIKASNDMNKVISWEVSKPIIADSQYFLDLVKPFDFPTNKKFASSHRGFLYAVEDGFSSFLPFEGFKGLIMISYPCLRLLACITSPIKSLATSVCDYVQSIDSDGRAFEKCVYESLGFFAGQRESFTLRELCQEVGEVANEISVFDLKLIGNLTSSDKWECCPSIIKKNNMLVTCNVDDIKTKAAGVYLLSDPSNTCADIVILADVDRSQHDVNTCQSNVERLVVFVQVKDWFKDSVKVPSRFHKSDGYNVSTFSIWRWGQQFVLSPTVYTDKYSMSSKSDGNNAVLTKFFEKNPSIKPVFILFSANPIALRSNSHLTTTKSLKCTALVEPNLRGDEGVTNLEHMKRWFPTVGYNLQVAHKLKSLWPWSKEDPK